MTVYTFEVKKGEVKVSKNGEKFSLVSKDRFALTAGEAYRRLADRTKFEYWEALAAYYEAGAPNQWVHDTEEETK